MTTSPTSRTLDELEELDPARREREGALPPRLQRLRRTPLGALSNDELRLALEQRWCVPLVAALALERLERDPLASCGATPGDLLRPLIDLEPQVWRRNPELHARYKAVLRASALARRELPPSERMRFWTEGGGAGGGRENDHE